jgi:hypothetical protein
MIVDVDHLKKNGDRIKTVCSLPGLVDKNSHKKPCFHAELMFIILARNYEEELATSDIHDEAGG